jgi:hypothetical protein
VSGSKFNSRVHSAVKNRVSLLDLPVESANDGLEVDVRQQYIVFSEDQLSQSGSAQLIEISDAASKHFDPFTTLNKIVVDFSKKNNTISDINKSDIVTNVANFVLVLRRSADAIENTAKNCGDSDVLDISIAAPGTLAAEIRRQIFGVFQSAACALGRAGPAAVTEDTRDMVYRLISSGQIEMYKAPPTRLKIKSDDPERWIKGTLAKYLDPDMITPSKDGVIPALNAAVYQNSGPLPKLKRFYDSLTYWRRSRSRPSESSNDLVAARAYEKARRAA